MSSLAFAGIKILSNERGLQLRLISFFRKVLLNGNLLEVSPEGLVPPLEPRPLPEDKLTIPGHSVGFWIVQGMHAEACT